MTVFIELLGPPGSGKTTLAETLLNEFPGKSLLAIDASANQQLTARLSLDPPAHTLTGVLQSLVAGAAHLPPKNEAIDWAFHDLPLVLGDDLDLIACGKDFFTDRQEYSEKTLAYGLGRLCRAYECVVLDGFHSALHAILPPDSLQVVVVALPDVTVSPLPGDVAFERTPGLIINRVANGTLSPLLEKLITEASLRLVGKIPHYPTGSECDDKFPEAFHNCLLRLDIPLLSQKSP